jgi:hypothetical protein
VCGVNQRRQHETGRENGPLNGRKASGPDDPDRPRRDVDISGNGPKARQGGGIAGGPLHRQKQREGARSGFQHRQNQKTRPPGFDHGSISSGSIEGGGGGGAGRGGGGGLGGGGGGGGGAGI